MWLHYCYSCITLHLQLHYSYITVYITVADDAMKYEQHSEMTLQL
jgi:hypothetical protein